MIAFFSALKEEREAVRRSWSLKPAGSMKGLELEMGDGCLHVCSGMGGERMGSAVELVQKTFNPQVFILVGFSVGLDPALRVGDLVYDERSTRTLIGRGGFVGRVATCGYLITASQKRTFAEKYPASPVADLETEAFLEAVSPSAERLVLRVVSDSVDSDLPLNFGEFVTEKGFPDVKAIGLKVATRPHLLPKLLKVGREAGVAVQALAGELEKHREELRARYQWAVL
ncbi:MAG: hypothetical protein WC423_12500 [Vulcanimicrobiota bacterium]